MKLSDTCNSGLANRSELVYNIRDGMFMPPFELEKLIFFKILAQYSTDINKKLTSMNNPGTLGTTYSPLVIR